MKGRKSIPTQFCEGDMPLGEKYGAVFEREIHASMKFLSPIDGARRPLRSVTTYFMKHMMEAYFRKLGEEVCYVSEASFIYGAFMLGIDITFADDCSSVYLSLKKSSLNEVASSIGWYI